MGAGALASGAGGHDTFSWTSYLPLLILAGVMIWRFRNLSRARPLRTGRMLILPLIYGALVALMLVFIPPSATGWLCIAGGVVVGAATGWQRARLMRLHRDPETGKVMVRQSPAGLILLVCVVGLRRLIAPGQPGVAPGAHGLPPGAMLFTDALIGFAFGMIVFQRIELHRRAKQLMGEGVSPT